MYNKDFPAFPIDKNQIDTSLYKNKHEGLTKREYFAAAAMQGFLSAWPDHAGEIIPSGSASYAVSCADALIEELNNPTHR